MSLMQTTRRVRYRLQGQDGVERQKSLAERVLTTVLPPCLIIPKMSREEND
jgi:hypothetical protein